MHKGTGSEPAWQGCCSPGGGSDPLKSAERQGVHACWAGLGSQGGPACSADASQNFWLCGMRPGHCVSSWAAQPSTGTDSALLSGSTSLVQRLRIEAWSELALPWDATEEDVGIMAAAVEVNGAFATHPLSSVLSQFTCVMLSSDLSQATPRGQIGTTVALTPGPA